MRKINSIEEKALFKVIEKYVDPVTKIPLIRDSNGNLCEHDNARKIRYWNDGGTYDFVSEGNKNKEREAGNSPLVYGCCGKRGNRLS